MFINKGAISAIYLRWIEIEESLDCNLILESFVTVAPSSIHIIDW